MELKRGTRNIWKTAEMTNPEEEETKYETTSVKIIIIYWKRESR